MSAPQRKIIHIDADAFYASVEIRDNPSLQNKPVAVGGRPEGRGVVSTCNYIARQFGIHSAMPAAHAVRLCPDLQFCRPNFPAYKEVSKKMRDIFARYTDEIEPLSLDEAYLDVSDCKQFNGSATLIAKSIKVSISKELGITVSAGVAPNKFLAKVASDWQKPDGLFVITPEQVATFVQKLPVKKINGVGKVTARKLNNLGIETCADILEYDPHILGSKFGKQGHRLMELAQGIDNRPVQTSRTRKSLSIENTYDADLPDEASVQAKLPDLFDELVARVQRAASSGKISKRIVKIKFNDFSQTTLENSISQSAQAWDDINCFKAMLSEAWQRRNKPVRLLGLGVRFADAPDTAYARQLDFFDPHSTG